MKRLVLIGGGHAHVHVLDACARQPFPESDITLISPYPRQIYSGMLPGWIAGHYSIEQCAGIRFVQTACTDIDLESKQVRCANGQLIPFDLVSIDSGPTVDLDHTPGASLHALPIRPIEEFVTEWPDLLQRARLQTPGFRQAIIGDGAAGTELAFAIAHRFSREKLTHARITLIGGNDQTLSGLPAGLRNEALSLLKQRGIEYLSNRRAIEFLPEAVCLSDDSKIACDASLIVTGAAAPAWPARSGLACDKDGFIRVTSTLQSVSHPWVFAAGDVAAYEDPRPKSGVFAVRAGPVLANNLISTGKRHALAAWGPLSTSGNWVWRWKDRIDRRFVQRYS